MGPPLCSSAYCSPLRGVPAILGPWNEDLLVVGCPDDNPRDPWLIVSDEPTGLVTFGEFGLGFDIAENFLDDKSNGFQVEASRLGIPEALEQVFFNLAVATLQFTSVGIGVAQAKRRRWGIPTEAGA